MPTYGYRCETCGIEFDVQQRMSDEPGADCPACGGPGKRLFFPAGIVFKGSGFYKTDSRSATSGSVGGSASTGSTKTGTPAAGDSSGGSGSGESASAGKSGGSSTGSSSDTSSSGKSPSGGGSEAGPTPSASDA